MDYFSARANFTGPDGKLSAEAVRYLNKLQREAASGGGDDAALAAHIADHANPHAVTAAQVGAPSGSGTSTGANTGDQFTSTTANKLLGRGTSGAGPAQEITLGSGLAMTGTTLDVTAGGTGTVTSVSVVSANGVSGSVATATTTPAITLALGAITPTSVAAVGTVTGSNLSGTHSGASSGTNTGDQTITLSGDVSGSGTGAITTAIGAGKVTLAMQANMATASVVYRKTAGAGAPEVQSLATLKTDLGLTGTNSGDQTITLTGDATGSGAGSFAVTVGKVNGVAFSGLATGILKNTTGTGVPSIAVAADFPTLNQNTTGSAATLTTPRAINGVNFDGSAAITVTAAAGTLTGATLAAGVTASSLTSFGAGIALGTPASGTLTNCTFPTLNQSTTGSAATLTTPRNINGVAFNGSANITVTADASTLTNTTLAAGVTASSLTSLGTIASLVATTAAISGGTVNNASIGATTASTVKATTVETTGNVGLGAAPSTSVGVNHRLPITGATIASGQTNQQTIQSGVTVGATVFATFPSTQAAAFTLASLSHYYADQGTIGAGSAVTAQMGFYARPSLTGAASNFGFRGGLAAASGAWNYYADGTANNAYAGLSRFGANTVPLNTVDITGSLGRGAPVTKTADFTLAATENWLICNKASSLIVTLPAASSFTGRELTIKTITAQTVVSASANVVPIGGGAAATAILPATIGAWATLVSDGTNWIVMAS